MNYVMANLHGAADRFDAMLKKIDFQENDALFLLGDLVDYGEDGMALLTDVSMRVNVFPVAGEHDFRALRMLSGFDKMLREGGAPTPAYAAEMMEWFKDGGQPTLDGFRALDDDMREGVLDYLSEMALYEEVEVGGREYVLVHAGIGRFSPDKELDEYEPDDFFTPAPAGARFFDDRVLVVGHTPTASGKIERDGNVIRIDCGVKDGGPLACLCLDTGAEFYV